MKSLPRPMCRALVLAVGMCHALLAGQAMAQSAPMRIPRIAATQSIGRLPLSPRERCHPIHRIAATQST